MQDFNQIISAITLSHLTEDQKFNQVLSNKDYHKQLDALRQIQKMMNSGEIASAEIFIRPVIFDIFLN